MSTLVLTVESQLGIGFVPGATSHLVPRKVDNVMCTYRILYAPWGRRHFVQSIRMLIGEIRDGECAAGLRRVWIPSSLRHRCGKFQGALWCTERWARGVCTALQQGRVVYINGLVMNLARDVGGKQGASQALERREYCFVECAQGSFRTKLGLME